MYPQQLWKAELCTAGCKDPDFPSCHAVCMHTHRAMQTLFSLGSLIRTQVSGHFAAVFSAAEVLNRGICVMGSSTVKGLFAELDVEKYDLFHKQPPVLKSTSPAFADWVLDTLQSLFGCIVQFLNMTKTARPRVQIRGLIFFMFGFGGSETRNSRKPAASSAPNSHLFTIPCYLPNN